MQATKSTKSTVHRPKLLLASAAALAAALAVVGLRASGLGPELPLNIAIALFAALALVTFILAIGPQKRTAPEEQEPDAEEGGGIDEEAHVHSHREQRLRELGISDEAAAFLCRVPTVSVHEVARLIDRGCPPPLAARIVWPD